LGLVTVTDYLAESYQRAGFPQEKLLVWPDAVDLERFATSPERKEARRHLGLSSDETIALYTGHFYEAKGVPALVDAAAQAPEVEFQLVGGWPDDIEAMRTRGAGASNLHFQGFQPNTSLPNWLAAADVLVLPNSGLSDNAHATSPLKLFEYMAARRPIVATKIPAVENILEHGFNAYLVEPDSPRALADGIRHVTENPLLGKALARRAFEKVQTYSWKQRARDVLDRFATWQ
jgi:glycosyltransferase involved in cell wall biosynthesis